MLIKTKPIVPNRDIVNIHAIAKLVTELSVVSCVQTFENYCYFTSSFWCWSLKIAPVSFIHSFFFHLSFFVCFADIGGQFITFTVNYFIYIIFRCQTHTTFTIVPKIIWVLLRCSLEIIFGCLLYFTRRNRLFVDVWNSLKIKQSAAQGVCVKFLSVLIVPSCYIKFSLCVPSEYTMRRGLFIDTRIH